jgi:hypothetical protein
MQSVSAKCQKVFALFAIICLGVAAVYLRWGIIHQQPRTRTPIASLCESWRNDDADGVRATLDVVARNRRQSSATSISSQKKTYRG